MDRVRVGVIGCGLIAQVMHLPYLLELRDQFEIAALCDISSGTLRAVADDYQVAARYTDWADLVAHDLDAVIVLTAGSHAAPCLAALAAGRHVFVEKPMCYSLDAADAMIAAAERSGVTLMVGNMKRFDPAYERAVTQVASLSDLRYIRVTTLEAPLLPYVQHYRLHRVNDVPAETLAALRAEQNALLREALGDSIPEGFLRLYSDVLLDSLVHEINMLAGILGEPQSITRAESWMSNEGLAAVLQYAGDVRCVLSWINLPELRNYSQELAFYGTSERVTLRLPSPFLRSAPSTLLLEGSDDGDNWEKAITVSYEEAFKRELAHFHQCVTGGGAPRTTAQQARRDLQVLQAITRCAAGGKPEIV